MIDSVNKVGGAGVNTEIKYGNQSRKARQENDKGFCV